MSGYFFLKEGQDFWIFGRGTQRGSGEGGERGVGVISKGGVTNLEETMWMSATMQEAIATTDSVLEAFLENFFLRRPPEPFGHFIC